MNTTERKPGGIKQVNCPTCQKIVPWREESQYRPFCSRQCQLIDFGDWANERHAIPLDEAPPGVDELLSGEDREM